MPNYLRFSSGGQIEGIAFGQIQQGGCGRETES